MRKKGGKLFISKPFAGLVGRSKGSYRVGRGYLRICLRIFWDEMSSHIFSLLGVEWAQEM